jgi:hypothetical protein
VIYLSIHCHCACSPRPAHTGRTCCRPSVHRCHKVVDGQLRDTACGGASNDWLRHAASFSPTRSSTATGTNNCSRHASHRTSSNFSHHLHIAFVRPTMFSRTIPISRATLRLSVGAQCKAQSATQRCAKLAPRTWQPLQQQLGRRYRSTIREQFREQYYKSPLLFPFAITV